MKMRGQAPGVTPVYCLVAGVGLVAEEDGLVVVVAAALLFGTLFDSAGADATNVDLAWL